jgi:hypothetical protein
MRMTAMIAAALMTVGPTLAFGEAGGEPPRLDDAHPPGALWFGGIPPRNVMLGYRMHSGAYGYGFYRRPVRLYRGRY